MFLFLWTFILVCLANIGWLLWLTAYSFFILKVIGCGASTTSLWGLFLIILEVLLVLPSLSPPSFMRALFFITYLQKEVLWGKKSMVRADHRRLLYPPLPVGVFRCFLIIFWDHVVFISIEERQMVSIGN